MCDRDLSKELMALKFSNTAFLFQNPVLLDDVRDIYAKNDVKLWLQSPSEVPPKVFHELFQKGLSKPVMNTTKQPLLLSLKPLYADLVFKGLNTAELRRRIASHIENRDAFVYVSSPIMELRGGFQSRRGLAWGTRGCLEHGS